VGGPRGKARGGRLDAAKGEGKRDKMVLHNSSPTTVVPHLPHLRNAGRASVARFADRATFMSSLLYHILYLGQIPASKVPLAERESNKNPAQTELISVARDSQVTMRGAQGPLWN